MTTAGTSPEGPPAAALRTELTVAQATDLARAGRLDEAGGLLDGLDAGALEAVGVLDLRARVHAQRGELAEADACWARLAARAPDHPGALAGRAAIGDIQGGRRGPRPRLGPRRAGAVAAVLVAALAVAAVLVWPLAVGDGGVTHQGGPAAAERPAAERDRSAVEARHATAVHTLATELAGPGVRVDERPDGVAVAFGTGLFDRSDRLTPAGAWRLTELGRRLTGRAGPITVIGHTAVVPGGPSSGGSVVGMARALVAARELAAASSRPLTAFALFTGDQSQSPFPDPARNRTVTLLVDSPAG